MKLRPWIPPVTAAFAVVGLVISVGKWEPRLSRMDRADLVGAPVDLCEGYPWRAPNSPDDRIMNLVLEDDGAYVGTWRIPYESFRVFMIKHAKIWRPDYVIISGTKDCRIGHGVDVFDTLRLLQLSSWLAPIAVQTGTRLPAIELWREGMPLEEWEQIEKESSAR